MLTRLQPGQAEIERLARRETDPRRAASFEPLALGPLPTVLALAALGIAAALVALPRLLVRLVSERGAR